MEKVKYKPTGEMAKAAKRGLELRKEFGRGATMVGVARANQLIRGDELPIEIVARMYSFFHRHRVDKKASGWKPSEKGYPSAGLVAWLVWGGDPGDVWSTRIWEKYKKDNNKSIGDFETLFNEESSDELIKSILNATK